MLVVIVLHRLIGTQSCLRFAAELRRSKQSEREVVISGAYARVAVDRGQASL
jgi:hypothetical protein